MDDNAILNKETKIKISTGNDKIECCTFNLLPGSAPLRKKDGTQLSFVEGTCTGCCEGICDGDCYACRDAIRYHNTVIPRLTINTLIARTDLDDLFSQLQRELNRFPLSRPFRPHSSGEYFSYEYFSRMNDFAESNHNRKFYDYTKRFEYMERFYNEKGGFPDNFAHNVSIWHKNYANPYKFAEFIYDDGTEPELKGVFHCPSVLPNGKRNHNIKCGRDCFRCINAKFRQRTAVYAH